MLLGIEEEESLTTEGYRKIGKVTVGGQGDYMHTRMLLGIEMMVEER